MAGTDEDDERWTMPLVVRVERDHPPAHTDVLEAAALACLVIWHDERATGEWGRAFTTWLDGRFRKVVRRARGSHWHAAEELPGVTVSTGTALVRAFPPAPSASLPKAITRLQVGGTDLVDPSPPPPPPAGAARLWLNPGLAMSTGKAAAQGGHASMLLWSVLGPEAQEAWRGAGYPLAVRVAEPRQWGHLASDAAVEVTDGGFTEIEPGSVTVRAEPPVGETPRHAP